MCYSMKSKNNKEETKEEDKLSEEQLNEVE